MIGGKTSPARGIAPAALLALISSVATAAAPCPTQLEWWEDSYISAVAASGDPFFTDGRRAVMLLEPATIPYEELEYFSWYAPDAEPAEPAPPAEQPRTDTTRETVLELASRGKALATGGRSVYVLHVITMNRARTVRVHRLGAVDRWRARSEVECGPSREFQAHRSD